MAERIGRRQLIGVAGAAALAGVLAGGAHAQETGHRKIVGVNGSPRVGKTTSAAIAACLEAAKNADPSLETEIIELGGYSIPAQLAAGLPLKDGETDDFPKIAAILSDPSVAGMVVGSPVYFGTPSALCKAFLDRCFEFRRDSFKLANKVVGALAVGSTRNGGQELTLQVIHTAMMGQNVVIVGTGQPSVRIGATLWNQNDSIEADEFGLGTARDLGRRVAEMASMVK